ncbi:MAG TPA: COX15/CtaA family protein [Rhodospirillales bacterium]|nr:COX15/CtaA family protein [Rhodospirillales bacterium]
MSETPIATVTQRRAIAWWLFAVATMILVMVMLGGVTRLTHSGLSMVEWRPVTGWLPPLNEAEWQDAFYKYQQYPEYQALNYGMTLGGFRSIYWLEYIHRVWGRLIAIVFAGPCMFFLARRWVDRSTGARLAVLFVLGALQGGLGWLMVQSGLVDWPDVSHYRLTAHLGLALALFGYTVWLLLETVRPASRLPPGREEPGFRRSAGLLAALAFVAALSGGLVAGLDAGFIFNTFPLMDGQLVPEGLLEIRPIYLNPFENLTTVQFDHRVLGAVVILGAIVLFWRVSVSSAPLRARLAAGFLAGMATVQAALGISTLVLAVPVALGILHQAGAFVLFAAALWTVRELRAIPASAPQAGPAEPRS